MQIIAVTLVEIYLSPIFAGCWLWGYCRRLERRLWSAARSTLMWTGCFRGSSFQPKRILINPSSRKKTCNLSNKIIQLKIFSAAVKSGRSATLTSHKHWRATIVPSCLMVQEYSLKLMLSCRDAEIYRTLQIARLNLQGNLSSIIISSIY